MAPVDWLAVPLNNVDRIEVVRGGGSALYGNNAVGGVVNIITKTGGKEPQFNISDEAGSYGMNSAGIGFSDSAGTLRTPSTATGMFPTATAIEAPSHPAEEAEAQLMISTIRSAHRCRYRRNQLIISCPVISQSSRWKMILGRR